MRPSDNIDASRAATHTTPGAMTRSMFISGPTPSGKRLTTMMKKNSVVRTSERRLAASRRSRRIIQKNMSGELQPLDGGAGYLDFLVGRHHDHAAMFQVPLYQTLYQFDCTRIECGQGLIQYPEHSTAYQQARQRHPAALPLGQHLGRQQLASAQSHMLQGVVGLAFIQINPPERAGDAQILDSSQIVFYPA